MTARQWITMIVLALIWGSSFLFIKYGLAEMPPMAVVAGRVLGGLLFLLVALLVRKAGLPRRGLWKPLLGVALLNNVFPWFLIAWGEQYIGSGLAAILNATTPLFSIIIASMWGDENFSISRMAGLVVGFTGVVILVGADLREFFTASSRVAIGELAVIFASLFYALGAVFARRYLRGESPMQLATGQLLIAALFILPLTLLPGNHPTTLPSPRAILAVSALGVFGSGLAYVLFYSLLEAVGATRTAVVTYLLPVVAIFLGWALLQETLSWQTIAGMILVLGGIGILNGAVSSRWRAMRAEGARGA